MKWQVTYRNGKRPPIVVEVEASNKLTALDAADEKLDVEHPRSKHYWSDTVKRIEL